MTVSSDVMLNLSVCVSLSTRVILEVWLGELKIFIGEDFDAAVESIQSGSFDMRRFMVVSRAVSWSEMLAGTLLW